VVRRPTGGRAVFHDDELTYSLSLPLSHPIAAGSVTESYEHISAALLLSFYHLRVPMGVGYRDMQPPSTTEPVCFDSVSPYEITVNQRKLIGSAQVRRGGRLLQHGSLPLQGDLARICDVLAYPDEASRERAKARVRTRAITLSQALGRSDFDWTRTAEALQDGITDYFEVQLVPDELNPAERQHAERTSAEIYANPNWTHRR
jgi:lipoate-protein ligase A